MDKSKEFAAINQQQQAQMLKLVTKGFYRELINYGIDKKDIVLITTHLLDHVMEKDNDGASKNTFHNNGLNVACIKDNWRFSEQLILDEIYITPLRTEMISQIAAWLRNPLIKFNFVSQFPDTENGLRDYFAQNERKYFGIFYRDKHVGIIGADHIDYLSRKLEMRKFVGDVSLHGKGIGKHATLLFLYFVFTVLDFNKVYIYSGDANISNLNLNNKFGFELEGILLEDVFFENEKRDVVRMGLLKSQWEKRFCQPSNGFSNNGKHISSDS